MTVNVLDVVSTRISVVRAKGRLSGRFAGVVKSVAGTVIGPGLALVDGQMVNAAVTEEQIGASVVLQNAGRAAAAYYVPATGGGAVTANSTVSGGSAGSVTDGVPVTRRIETVWPLQGGGALSQNLYLSFDGTAVAKPYATTVVAAVNSQAPQAAQADFVCTGEDDDITLTAALSRGGAVLLLDGDYSLSGSVQLVNGVRLAGMGYGATRLLATTSAPLLTKNSVWYRAQLADLTLDGSDLAVGLSCNLLACTVERVNFTRSPGVGLVASAANGVLVAGCQFDNGARGVEIGDAVGVTLRDCRFLGLTEAGAVLQRPLRSLVSGCTFRKGAKGLVLGVAA
jgi:hypothetical protein